MATVPPRQAAAAGGMVNMARGLGTAFRVAVVILALYAAARLGHAGAGPVAAMAPPAAAALVATWAGRGSVAHGAAGAGGVLSGAGNR